MRFCLALSLILTTSFSVGWSSTPSYEEAVKNPNLNWDSKVVRRTDYNRTMSIPIYEQMKSTAVERESIQEEQQQEQPEQQQEEGVKAAADDTPEVQLPETTDKIPESYRVTEAVGACTTCDEAKKKAAEKIVVKKDEPKPSPTPKPTPTPKPQERAENFTGQSASYLDKLMKAIRSGTYKSAGKNMCYRGVKMILQKAGIVKYYLPGGNAYDAMKALPKAGFKNYFPNKCNVPGVIRVYKGAANGMSKAAAKRFIWKKFKRQATAGDRAGHIEVLGSDKRYYHFTSSSTPINDPKTHFGPNRRILEGCFLK